LVRVTALLTSRPTAMPPKLTIPGAAWICPVLLCPMPLSEVEN
jgi:hypothetical protein